MADSEIVDSRTLALTLVLLVGVLFNYRVTFGIITTAVGLQDGWLDQSLFTAILPDRTRQRAPFVLVGTIAS